MPKKHVKIWYLPEKIPCPGGANTILFPFFFWTLGQNLNEFSKNFQSGGKYRTFWIMFAFLHNFHIFHKFLNCTQFLYFSQLCTMLHILHQQSICSTSASSSFWSLFLKLFKPLALCQQLMFYISTGTTSWKAGLSFSVNIFRFCLYPIHPHSIFTLTRRWKVHICQSWRKQESLMRTYLSPVIIKLMKFGMLNCRGA